MRMRISRADDLLLLRIGTSKLIRERRMVFKHTTCPLDLIVEHAKQEADIFLWCHLRDREGYRSHRVRHGTWAYVGIEVFVDEQE